MLLLFNEATLHIAFSSLSEECSVAVGRAIWQTGRHCSVHPPGEVILQTALVVMLLCILW